MFWLRRKKSGTKEYAVVTADDPKGLLKLARKLRLPVHGKGAQEKHLDVKGHKIAVVKKLGAVEKTE